MNPLGDESRPTRVYVFSHTHWDREWYLSQRQFQVVLGDTMDEVLEALERDPSFPPFTADGQTCLVEDYLEIRSANRDRLLSLIQKERILIGPWYTMPDLWLPDGESLIRNLLAGRRDCQKYGVEQPLIGYVPDSFGHIEQMPQILGGFGIDNYVFGRGEPCDKKLKGLDFTWVSPDGHSEVTCHLLPDGYQNAMMLPEATDREALLGTIRRALKPYEERSACPQLALLCNGVDHIWLQRDLPEILKSARELLPDHEFMAGGIKDFLDDFSSREIVIEEHRGILQSRKLRADLLHGTWSSRIDHKLANARSLMVLESWAEPLSALSETLLHGKARRHEIDLAWRLLLQNHAHDSICGCSIDRVGLDVDRRFVHSQEISESVAEDALGVWASALSPNAAPKLLVVAGLGGRSGCVEILVDSPEAVCPSILDEYGAALPCQALSHRHLARLDAVVNRDLPEASDYLETGVRSFEFWEHRLLVKPPTTSACSLHAYAVSYEGGEQDDVINPVAAGERFLENHLLRVDVARDGTIQVLHRASGLLYTGLLEIRDEADLGGGYIYTPMVGDQARRSVDGDVANVTIIEQGPLRASLRIEMSLLLPTAAEPGGQRRSAETVACDWVTEVFLESGSETVQFRSKLTNRARNHRMRLIFPMPFAAARANVERAFVVAEESPDRYEAEPGQNSHAMRNWVAVENSVGGVAFIGKGLHEWTLHNNELAVTVLRSIPFVGTCGSWSTPDALMLKEVPFDFALAFHAGSWRDGQVPSRAAEFVHESLAHVYGQASANWSPLPHASIMLEEVSTTGRSQVSSHRSTWQRHFGARDGWRRDRKTSPKSSMLETSSLVPVEWSNPQVLLSALKRADDEQASKDLILRFYSLDDQSGEVLLHFGLPIVKASLSDLREEPLRVLEIENNSVRVIIRPFEIVTLRIQVGDRPYSKSSKESLTDSSKNVPTAYSGS